MSQQQPMWKRPSGPKPRAYRWSNQWAADINRPGEHYTVSLHHSYEEALKRAIKYAAEAQQ